MPKLNQFETLVIDEFEEEKFHLPEHSHTYYEIIYIKKGCGVHHLNKNLLSYKAGDLFVLSPDDEHYFDIKKSTKLFPTIAFCYVKLNEIIRSIHEIASNSLLVLQQPVDVSLLVSYRKRNTINPFMEPYWLVSKMFAN